jgi:predicted MFS family arabinose efflux permease
MQATHGADHQAATFRDVFGLSEFRALWLAEVQSVAGDQLARVAMTILVFARTDSAALTALTYALTYLPDLAGGPLLAGLADRYPRRRVMVVCDVARAGLVATMALPGMPLPVLALLLLVVQLCAPPFAAAQFATLKIAIEGDRLDVAQAIRLATHQVAQMIGFASAGALVTLIGTGQALAVDAATFLFSAVLIRRGVRHRPAPTPAGGDPTTYIRQVAAGARIIWRSPALRGIIGLAWLAGFIVVPEGLAVPYTGEINAGPAAVGILLAAQPLGGAIGSLVLSRAVAPARRQRLVGPCAVAAIVPLILFAARPGLVVALPLLVLSGFCAAYQVTAVATFARLVPDQGSAQAFGLAGSGLIVVQGVGIVGGGALAQAFDSAALAIAIAGLAGAVVGVAVAANWRRSANRTSRATRSRRVEPSSASATLDRST